MFKCWRGGKLKRTICECVCVCICCACVGLLMYVCRMYFFACVFWFIYVCVRGLCEFSYVWVCCFINVCLQHVYFVCVFCFIRMCVICVCSFMCGCICMRSCAAFFIFENEGISGALAPLLRMWDWCEWAQSTPTPCFITSESAGRCELRRGLVWHNAGQAGVSHQC